MKSEELLEKIKDLYPCCGCGNCLKVNEFMTIITKINQEFINNVINDLVDEIECKDNYGLYLEKKFEFIELKNRLVNNEKGKK